MTHRVNVMLDERAWAELQQIPRGERSRFVSEAVREAALRRSRRDAASRLHQIRSRIAKPEGSAEQWVREDRTRQ
jgi:transposase